MYLAGEEGGWPMQHSLWRLRNTGTLRVHTSSEAETARMNALMEQYRDRPMDLADASLVAAAEAFGYTHIFSIDSDFYVYRLLDGRALEVLPGPLPTKGKRS